MPKLDVIKRVTITIKTSPIATLAQTLPLHRGTSVDRTIPLGDHEHQNQ